VTFSFEQAVAHGWQIHDAGPDLVRGEKRTAANYFVREEGTLDEVLDRISRFEAVAASRKTQSAPLVPPPPNPDEVEA
jgi:hypothetical protein